MQAYFEGRRELFDGLALGRLGAEWKSSPVIRLDMSMVKPTSVEGLRARLDDLLRGVEQTFAGGERLAETLGGRLDALIRHAAAGNPASVVILVDEYDVPLLDVIDDEVLLDRFRQVMREFYAPLKACDEHLRFVFLTGITKFSQLSIFSELNHLSNISTTATTSVRARRTSTTPSVPSRFLRTFGQPYMPRFGSVAKSGVVTSTRNL